MGRDKVENEDLIKYGDDEDVWFHVDKLSSAHVYLRLPIGMKWDSIPTKLLEDLGQLVKANSIEGNKKNNQTIIYTPWRNIKKQGDMAIGTVMFHNDQIVKRHHIAQRDNAIVNRLNKTKREEKVDHEAVRQEREKERNKIKRDAANKLKNSELEEKRKRLAAKEAADYSNVYSQEAIEEERERKEREKAHKQQSNSTEDQDEEDDGMDSDDSFM
jgi:NFACT protein RNA binding domain